ncbi:MAG: hypothetical protein ABUL60_10015 [Myxococcales bacterium]
MISRFVPSPRIRRLLAGAAAGVVCLAGGYLLSRKLDEAYTISEWLIWRLAPIWGYTLLFNASCVAFGAFLTRKLLQQRPLPALERLLQSMMLGLTAFVLSLYVLGFAHLFKPSVALLLPAVFLLVGARDAAELWRELLAWRGSIAAPRPVERVLGTLAIFAGAAALVFLYIEALDVSAINFDATWYHFPIAQDYAREGRIVPFPGDSHRAFPHLTSMVHTWALLVPRLPILSQHWMLSLHLEFSIVVWRLVGAATLARWLLGGRDVRGLWAGFFLFPSVFVYDQSIGGSADHFLGFFAVPVVLAAVRALERFDLRWCVLLGVALGGHVLVKYQGVYLFAGVALAVSARLAFLGGRYWLHRRRGLVSDDDVGGRGLLRGAATIALAFALVSSAHFGKNAVFYHNPFYPFAQKLFKASTPKRQPGFYAETPIREAFEPRQTGLRRQVWALGKMFDYSLETSNRSLTKHRPYMGALFSLLLPCALLVPGRRRFGVVVGVLALAFLAWANSAPNDRYLLAFLDLCIGVTLALLVEVWELGWPARAGLVPLVSLQLIWGGDAMFVYGGKQLSAGLDLIQSGWDGQADSRLAARGTQQQITRATPKNAVILSRNYKGLLGLDRTVLLDVRATQDYISYANLKDTRQFFDLVKSRGVTHLMYPKGQRRPERWNNVILFTDLFEHYAQHVKRFGKLVVGEMPSEPPPASVPYLVVASGVRGVKDGVWAVEQLDFDPRDPTRFAPRPSPRRPLTEARSVLGQVQALVLGRRKTDALSQAELAQFEQVESWDGEQLWLRRR